MKFKQGAHSMNKKIQLYSLATPNGQKVSIALEEMNIDYVPHKIDITKDEQFTDEFIKINPNSKIPAIVDPEVNNGKDFAVFESGAILLYLAEKSGKFLSKDPFIKNETLQWLFFQMAGVGPMFGQFGHFYKYAKDKCEDPYPTERYANETKRLLGVLEKRLADREFIMGSDITIADFATMPWVDCLSRFYEADDILELKSFKNVMKWKNTLLERPKVQKGMEVCPF